MLVAKMTEYAKLSILPQRCSLVINPLQKFHSYLILLTTIQEKHADLHKRCVSCPPAICGSSMASQGRKKGREYFIVTTLEFLILSLIHKFLLPNKWLRNFFVYCFYSNMKNSICHGPVIVP